MTDELETAVPLPLKPGLAPSIPKPRPEPAPEKKKPAQGILGVPPPTATPCVDLTKPPYTVKKKWDNNGTKRYSENIQLDTPVVQLLKFYWP